jgi:hypothetical protein
MFKQYVYYANGHPVQRVNQQGLRRANQKIKKSIEKRGSRQSRSIYKLSYDGVNKSIICEKNGGSF